MLLRSFYLILGVFVGAVWMAASPTSYRVVDKTVHRAKAMLDLGDTQKVVQLKKATPLQAGYNKPRMVFINEDLLDVPLNWNWNYISDEPVYGDANWLYYGAIGDVDEQFVIGHIQAGQHGPRVGGVRSELSDLKIFKKKKIKLHFIGRNRDLSSSIGKITTANFAYRHNGIGKMCTAFMMIAADKAYHLEGFYCAPSGKQPKDSLLACLLDSVNIYNEAYWTEPDSGKAERKGCRSGSVGMEDARPEA